MSDTLEREKIDTDIDEGAQPVLATGVQLRRLELFLRQKFAHIFNESHRIVVSQQGVRMVPTNKVVNVQTLVSYRGFSESTTLVGEDIIYEERSLNFTDFDSVLLEARTNMGTVLRRENPNSILDLLGPLPQGVKLCTSEKQHAVLEKFSMRGGHTQLMIEDLDLWYVAPSSLEEVAKWRKSLSQFVEHVAVYVWHSEDNPCVVDIYYPRMESVSEIEDAFLEQDQFVDSDESGIGIDVIDFPEPSRLDLDSMKAWDIIEELEQRLSGIEIFHADHYTYEDAQLEDHYKPVDCLERCDNQSAQKFIAFAVKKLQDEMVHCDRLILFVRDDKIYLFDSARPDGRSKESGQNREKPNQNTQ